MQILPRILEIQSVEPYQITCVWNTGEIRTNDLTAYAHGPNPRLQRLADVAQRLKGYKSIQTLTVLGYTDRLGGDDYNDKLSEARARTVQTYLESLGVKSALVVAQGKGKRDPVSKDCSATASREQQITCLQPDRRVTIEVTGVAR